MQKQGKGFLHKYLTSLSNIYKRMLRKEVNGCINRKGVIYTFQMGFRMVPGSEAFLYVLKE
jgi:hypothetical protein